MADEHLGRCPHCGTSDLVVNVLNGESIWTYVCGYVETSEFSNPCSRSSGPRCTCAILDLMARGCRCGAFQEEQRRRKQGDSPGTAERRYPEP